MKFEEYLANKIFVLNKSNENRTKFDQSLCQQSSIKKFINFLTDYDC